MLGDKQEQSAQAGSTAVQAGRDVHFHGMSVTDVRELCILFLRDNFPKLREEAIRVAEEHVKAFASNLEDRIANDAAKVELEKFSDPDVQATINDAVLAAARKGDGAHPNILCTLISERVSKISNNYKEIVLAEAIHVVPRLTSEQISFISFAHFVRSLIFQQLPNVNALEEVGRIGLKIAHGGLGLSKSQRQHIQYSGAATIFDMLTGDIYDIMRQEYKYLGFADGATFKSSLLFFAPSYNKLLEHYVSENLFSVNLTSVGQAIAIANISNHINGLDYSVWLK
jgi:hypothetical protein